MVIALVFLLLTICEGVKVGNYTCLDYGLVFWNFHIHTSFSNRKGTDLDHRFAPNLNEVHDFCQGVGYGMIGLDHGELLSQSQWVELKKKSNELSSISRMFQRGFEWTSGSVLDSFPIDFAHIGVANTKRFAGSKRLTPDCNADVVKSYILMWEWLDNNLGEKGIWGFAHPWLGLDQFSDFDLSPYQLVNERCCWIEIAGGPQNRKARDGLDYYARALQQGWKVGPAYGSDNFSGFGPNEINNFTGIPFYDFTGTYPWMTLNLIAIEELLKRRMYVCEVGGHYGVYFLCYFTLRSGVKIVMGDTVIPRSIPYIDNFVIDTTMDINQIREILYYLIYPKEIKKFVVKNRRGVFNDSEVMQTIRNDPPMAFFVCLVAKDNNYVVGSPIFFDRTNP